VIRTHDVDVASGSKVTFEEGRLARRRITNEDHDLGGSRGEFGGRMRDNRSGSGCVEGHCAVEQQNGVQTLRSRLSQGKNLPEWL
jgi:hypothetical protein